MNEFSCPAIQNNDRALSATTIDARGATTLATRLK